MLLTPAVLLVCLGQTTPKIQNPPPPTKPVLVPVAPKPLTPQNPAIKPPTAVKQLAKLIDFTFESGGIGWNLQTSMPYGSGPGSQQFIKVTPRDWDESDVPTPPTNMPLGGDYWQKFDVRGLLGKGGEGEGYYDSSMPDLRANKGDLSTYYVGDRSIRWQGVATSVEFKLAQPFIQFLIGGAGGGSLCQFELQARPAQGDPPSLPRSADGFNILHAAAGTTPDGSLNRLVWDVTPYQGRMVRLVIRDQSPTGFVAVDDIRFTETGTPLVHQSRPAALWGFADTHAHPAAHLAFGGNVYWGDPTWDPAQGKTPETTLVDCQPGHGVMGTGLRSVDEGLALGASAAVVLPRLVVNLIGGLLPGVQVDTLGGVLHDMPNVPHTAISRLALNAVEESLGHRTSGVNPTPAHQYDGWPRADSRTHQHMHEAWIRRAFDGGLRLMVAHTVETELIANLNPNPRIGALTNRASVVRQINWIKAMAQRHSSWMAIAYSPKQAREIIASGKLAIVLGVEADNIGDFGRPGAPAVTAANIQAYLDELHRMGVRHLFPIHLANNPFGGFSLYNPLFDLNSLVLNGSLPNLREGAAEGIYYESVAPMLDMLDTLSSPADRARVQQQIRTAIRDKGLENIRLDGGLNVPLGRAFDQIASLSASHGADFKGPNRAHHGFANADGLTPTGERFIREMIARGMIIDIDHMSTLSARKTLDICEAAAKGSPDGRGYPVIGGHATFRGISFAPNGAVPGHSVGMECDKDDETLARMRALGGMASPITAGKGVQAASLSDVPNNCPDSSSAWAQQYFYGSQRFGGRGVGIATDMALNGALGPRFGPGAAKSLGDVSAPNWSLGYDSEQSDYAKIQIRQGAIGPFRNDYPWFSVWFAQRNPVAYRTPLTDWRGYRWEKGAGYTEKEKDAFCAVAAWQSGAAESAFEAAVNGDQFLMPVYGMPSTILGALRDSPATLGLGPALDGRRKWMINVFKGLTRNSLAEISNPPLGDAFKGPDIELAAFDVRTGRPSPRSAAEMPGRVIGFDHENYLISFAILKKVLGQMTMVKNANHAPLVRSTLGPRQFDFNFDGLAHYGLLPDMLQDLKNNGMTNRDFVPLFRSAEDYIRMWERCEQFSNISVISRQLPNIPVKPVKP